MELTNEKIEETLLVIECMQVAKDEFGFNKRECNALQTLLSLAEEYIKLKERIDEGKIEEIVYDYGWDWKATTMQDYKKWSIGLSHAIVTYLRTDNKQKC